jgi:hypothetical protein
MIRIDDTLLEEIGLIALPKQDRDQLLRQIYETLEMRVGMRLAERMTDQQLDEFERFIDTNDEAGALKWLESNFPDYKQVVADELEKLKGEIKQDSSKILQTMQSQQPPQVTQPSTAPAINTWDQTPQQSVQPQQSFTQPLSAPEPFTAPTNTQPQQFQAAAPQPVQPLQPYTPAAQPQQPTTSDDTQADVTQQEPPTFQNIPPPPSFN